MFYLCLFALLHLSFNSNSVSFVEKGRKNISCSRAQVTLAMPLGFGSFQFAMVAEKFEKCPK